MNPTPSAIPANDAARSSALAKVISEQRTALEQLRKDSDDLAAMVADEVLERFEREVEDHLGENYDHELSQMVRTGLCGALSMAYEESFERHVLARIGALRQQIEPYLNGAAFYDEAYVGLRSSRAGLKLWQDAGEWIDDALKAGRPSAANVVGSILGDWFGDLEKQFDRTFRELEEAAKRARRAVLALRPRLRERIREDTLSLIREARLGYAKALEGISIHNC